MPGTIPARIGAPSLHHVYEFHRPEWLATVLRVIIEKGVPLFEGASVLAILGKPVGAVGPTYARMPDDHKRKVPRGRLGLTGRGRGRLYVLTLEGVRRLIQLRMRQQAREGLPPTATAFEAVLRSDILPAIEAATGMADLWDAQQVEPSTAERLAKLRAWENENLSIALYGKLRKLHLTARQSRDLGMWCAEHCRVYEVRTDGPGQFPRRVLDKIAASLKLARAPRARTWEL